MRTIYNIGTHMQLPFMVIAREQKFMSAHFRVHPFLVNSMIFFPLYIFNSYILRCSGYVLAVVMYGQEKQLNFCSLFRLPVFPAGKTAKFLQGF